MTFTQHYDSPLGSILLTADEMGLTGLWFDGQKHFARDLPAQHTEQDTPVLLEAKRWLDVYFTGREPDFLPALHPIGSAFRRRVWDLLLRVPYGQTVTYGQLAQQLAAACPGSVTRGGADGVRLTDWTAAQFAQSDALIFVGAAGIAVRAIAPHCRSKAADPAVVVLDEGGQFAIPLLSGHLGGANELAQRLAAVCHAVPVITTATDGRGVFAVDEWAKRQNCAVAEPERIRCVSGALLAGQSVCYAADWAVSGTPPAGVEPAAAADRADFALTLTPTGEALHLIPRIAVLGVGCKRGTTAEKLETAFAAFCAEHHFAPQGIVRAASIDLKKDEPGLAAFCLAHGWEMDFYTAAALRTAKGRFTSSGFVQSITGVDNVCERAAVLAADGVLFIPKWARDGVTLAVALAPFAPDWRWKNDEP